MTLKQLPHIIHTSTSASVSQIVNYKEKQSHTIKSEYAINFVVPDRERQTPKERQRTSFFSLDEPVINVFRIREIVD